jgi:hypothetical protein
VLLHPAPIEAAGVSSMRGSFNGFLSCVTGISAGAIKLSGLPKDRGDLGGVRLDEGVGVVVSGCGGPANIVPLGACGECFAPCA